MSPVRVRQVVWCPTAAPTRGHSLGLAAPDPTITARHDRGGGRRPHEQGKFR